MREITTFAMGKITPLLKKGNRGAQNEKKGKQSKVGGPHYCKTSYFSITRL